MKLSNDFVSYEIDGEKILVCMDSSKFAGVVKLNSTAGFITDQLKACCSKEDLIGALVEKFSGVDRTQAETDLDSVLGILASVGAIEE